MLWIVFSFWWWLLYAWLYRKFNGWEQKNVQCERVLCVFVCIYYYYFFLFVCVKGFLSLSLLIQITHGYFNFPNNVLFFLSVSSLPCFLMANAERIAIRTHRCRHYIRAAVIPALGSVAKWTKVPPNTSFKWCENLSGAPALSAATSSAAIAWNRAFAAIQMVRTLAVLAKKAGIHTQNMHCTHTTPTIIIIYHCNVLGAASHTIIILVQWNLAFHCIYC